MLPPNPALEDFPSDIVREQFDRVFSSPNFVPTSPKIHELRNRHEKSRTKTLNTTEIKLDLTR